MVWRSISRLLPALRTVSAPRREAASITATHGSAFPRRDQARVVRIVGPPWKWRAQGAPGARTAPAILVGEKGKSPQVVRQAEIARHSLRNGFTAYSALSLGYRAF